ncbi:MAG: MTAP family purine nucleoside phosphorylase [Nitrospirota bacterium]
MNKIRKNDIPEAKKAFIGGSSTFAINFPEDLKHQGAKIIARKTFATPFGKSPEITIFEINREPVLTVKMHGWRSGVSRADASRRVFWVFEKAGVKIVLAEGGVGTVRQNFRLRDFIIPDDYIDLSLRKDVSLSDKYLLIMRDPICPELSTMLIQTSKRLFTDRNVNRGIYAVTDGRHFESRAEVRMIRTLGGDVIGQSLCPEVYLAREIGACYAGIYLIVNRAEGVGRNWSHAKLRKVFYSEAMNVGKIIIESLKQIEPGQRKGCKCSKLRKKTLLRT